ncbi:MAG TPA: hypothetical protein DCK83_07115 [Gallionellaceae bacterium]|nr:hypothetical protein [Gallionellaceae bacterium]
MAGTLVLDESDLDLLPPSMRQFALEYGLPALLCLVEAYAGTRVRVPVNPNTESDLFRVLGGEVYLALVKAHPGETYEVARCLRAARHLVYRQIQKDSLELSQRELALKYKYTERHIRNIEMLGEVPPDRNGSLF